MLLKKRKQRKFNNALNSTTQLSSITALLSENNQRKTFMHNKVD